MKQSLKFDFQPSFDLCMRGKDLSDDNDVISVMEICNDLYMLNRTLISDDYDSALNYLGNILPMKIHSMKSKSTAWTWTVPPKWSVKKATIHFDNKCICDWSVHPLYLSSYSIPYSGRISKNELLKHIITDPDRPNAIPYHYHYYNPAWSFCLPFNLVKDLKEGDYDVEIDTEFADGELKIGEWVIPGDSEESILFSAHLCHPGQVNDGLLGVAIGLCLMKWLSTLSSRNYTYRFIAHPENIGSLCYFHENKKFVKNIIGAVFLEMLGNKNHIKLQKSKQGNTFIDELMGLALEKSGKPYGVGPFRKVICNDEININGPGIDIPCVSITRWPYPEYHTSDDNPGMVSMEKIKESIDICKKFIELIEHNVYPVRKYIGNLFLSKFGLYEDLNKDDTIEKILLSFEGNKSILEISKELSVEFEQVVHYANKFHEKGLISLEFTPQDPLMAR
jgi:aminopeptidase-like protein